MSEQTMAQVYEGLYRSQAEDHFQADAHAMAGQGWQPVDKRWDGKGLTVRYAYRPPKGRRRGSPPRKAESTHLPGDSGRTTKTRSGLGPMARLAAVVGSLFVAFVLVSLGSGMLTGAGGVGGPAATKKPSVLAPAGMTGWADDPGLSWRWSTDGEIACELDRPACWGMVVVATDGCPIDLYVLLQVMDQYGAVLGYSDDLFEGLAAGAQAELQFSWFSARAAGVRPYVLYCN